MSSSSKGRISMEIAGELLIYKTPFSLSFPIQWCKICCVTIYLEYSILIKETQSIINSRTDRINLYPHNLTKVGFKREKDIKSGGIRQKNPKN